MPKYFRSITVDKEITHIGAKDMVVQFADDISAAQPFITEDTALITQAYFQLHGMHMAPVMHNNFCYLEQVDGNKIILPGKGFQA